MTKAYDRVIKWSDNRISNAQKDPSRLKEDITYNHEPLQELNLTDTSQVTKVVEAILDDAAKSRGLATSTKKSSEPAASLPTTAPLGDFYAQSASYDPSSEYNAPAPQRPLPVTQGYPGYSFPSQGSYAPYNPPASQGPLPIPHSYPGYSSQPQGSYASYNAPASHGPLPVPDGHYLDGNGYPVRSHEHTYGQSTYGQPPTGSYYPSSSYYQPPPQ
nr:uncharacterized protein CI109_006567 [Kwoniella shandongensis]KAA5525105.1 hypothetical protein CI109_006567 [Kwoniella shandongensis]